MCDDVDDAEDVADIAVPLMLQDRVSFWFGTGGAGFCISRALALKMSPFAR